ncbi:MAG: dihydropteroate synthase [Gammaproteobacteria bacterium]|nr:dihydropteroate synthase [Gammaproteobacteria bacterium]
MTVHLDYSRPLLMGVLNVTPDSFSDGGVYPSSKDAIACGIEMVEQGADIIDVGGESTRPGSTRVGASEQKRRVIDVIAGLHAELPEHIHISIDTTLSEVAYAALDAGATMLNDVSAGREDMGLLKLAAVAEVPVCLMHMRGEPATMQDHPDYENVTREVSDFLLGRAEKAQDIGVKKDNIILDPGIGFGKRTQHNLELLRDLKMFTGLGYPVMLGTSRKRFMGEILKQENPRARMPATCATSSLGVLAGVKIFRVHDVWQNRQAIDVTWAIHTS